MSFNDVNIGFNIRKNRIILYVLVRYKPYGIIKAKTCGMNQNSLWNKSGNKRISSSRIILYVKLGD